MKYAFFILTLFCFLNISQYSQAQVYNMSTTPITTCGGTFRDSGGSGHYANYTNIAQTFTPSTPGTRLQFTFTSFNTQANFDLLTIHDGNINGPIIGTYSGTQNPGVITATSSSGKLTFLFEPSDNVTAEGWEATIACVPGQAMYSMSNLPLTVCSGTYYDSKELLNYGPNENFTQTFSPSTTGKMLRFEFTTFATEAQNDVLRIYDGPSTASPFIGSYSGTNSPGVVTATNPAGQLTFRFTSNSLYSASGWVAQVSCEEVLNSPQIESSEIVIFPNPSSGQLTLVLPGPLSLAYIKVLNMLGQQVMHAVDPAVTSINSVDLNLKQLPKGMYLIQVQNGPQLITHKVMLE